MVTLSSSDVNMVTLSSSDVTMVTLSRSEKRNIANRRRLVWNTPVSYPLLEQCAFCGRERVVNCRDNQSDNLSISTGDLKDSGIFMLYSFFIDFQELQANM